MKVIDIVILALLVISASVVVKKMKKDGVSNCGGKCAGCALNCAKRKQ